MDIQEEINNELRLIELFIDGLSKTSCKNQHLLITSFLTAKMDDGSSMTAFVAPVKSKFKELVKTKTGKYKKGLFETTLKKLSYTAGGYKTYNDMYNIREDVRVGISRYTYSTVFLVSNELQEINSLNLLNICDNYVISVVEPFYSIVKRYENNYNFDKCINDCNQYRKNKEEKKLKKQVKKKIN